MIYFHFTRKIDSLNVRKLRLFDIHITGLSAYTIDDMTIDDFTNKGHFILQIPRIFGRAMSDLESMLMGFFPMNCCKHNVPNAINNCPKNIAPCNATFQVENMGIDINFVYSINSQTGNLDVKDLKMKVIPGNVEDLVQIIGKVTKILGRL